MMIFNNHTPMKIMGTDQKRRRISKTKRRRTRRKRRRRRDVEIAIMRV